MSTPSPQARLESRWWPKRHSIHHPASRTETFKTGAVKKLSERGMYMQPMSVAHVLHVPSHVSSFLCLCRPVERYWWGKVVESQLCFHLVKGLPLGSAAGPRRGLNGLYFCLFSLRSSTYTQNAIAKFDSKIRQAFSMGRLRSFWKTRDFWSCWSRLLVENLSHIHLKKEMRNSFSLLQI